MVGVVLILILGGVALSKMTIDLLPNMSLPYVVVMTPYPGASPEEVESKVTTQIEAAMATTSNIENVTSSSYNNYSMVILEYAQETDMDSTIVEMRERLDQIEGSFEDVVGTPVIMQLDPDMLPVLVASVDRKGMDSLELSRYMEQELVPELESIEGVASVQPTGTVTQSIDVVLNEKKIKELNKKIKAKIEEQFSSAQQELDQAKEKIEDGKSQLQGKQQEMADQASSAQKELTQKKQELYQTEEDLRNKLEELKTQKSNVEGLIAVLTQLQKTAQELGEQRVPIDSLLQNYTPEQLAQMGQDVQLLLQQQKQIEEALNQIGQGLQPMQEQLGAMGIQLNSYEDLPAAIAALQQVVIQINTGMETINTALSNIQQGKVGLEDALNTINQGQIAATIQMNSAYTEMKVGESQLENAQNELDASRNSAKEAADVNSVLSVETLGQILTAQNFSMPVGYITEKKVEYLVKVGDKIADEKELKNMVMVDLGMDGIEPIVLSDVADVKKTDNSEEVYAKVNQNPAVMLSFEKQTGYSTGDVARRVKKRFAQLTREQEGLQIKIMMDQSVYIDMIVDSVLENMIVGAILAILILIIFLKDIRPTFVIACSIPLSVIFAVVLMYFTDITLNIISMSGLALGIGMLVDNSIVVIENIYRLRNEGYSVKKAAVEGAGQVTGAIIASTLTTVCVFAPIIFTEGITRQLFVDMGLTIAFSLAASLIVAMMFVPMMSSAVLYKTQQKQHPVMEKIRYFYQGVLGLALRWKFVVFAIVLVFLFGSIKLAVSRGTAFMPKMESTQATVTVHPEGKVEFDELKEISDQVIDAIAEIKDVDTIGAMAGGNNMLGVSSGKASSVTMYLLLKEDPKLSNQQLENEILKRTKDIPCELEVNTSSMDMSAMMGDGIVVQVKGNDLEKLSKVAKDVRKIVEKVKGTENVEDGQDNTINEFEIRVDKAKAVKYNMTVAQVYQLVYNKLADSKSATTISTDLNEYKVYVASEKQVSLTRKKIKDLTFTYKDRMGKEEEVDLEKIAKFEEKQVASVIGRDSQQRYINISAQIAEGDNVGLVADRVKKAIDAYKCPSGYSIEMTGEDETINEAMEQIYLMMLLAVAFIYLIMVAQFQSLLSPFIIMFTIPLAFTGGFFALFVSGNEVSVIAMIGFVMLAGIIVNNGIVLVDYINQLRKAGMEKKEAILEAGSTRLRPILMTALTTIFAMSGMALGMGNGSEMMQPMAVVTIGGLIYGTLLTLIVVPCIYDVFHRNKSMVEEEI